MRIFGVVSVVLWGCVVASALAQPVPPLPQLALDSYPPPARDAISKTYVEAAANPDNTATVGTLARTLHAWEQWSAAHEVYSRAEALAPQTFEWFYLDGVVLQRLARHGDAAALFERALRLKPVYLPARVKLAESLLDAGNIDDSRRLFEALAREPASEPAAQLGLGRIAAAQGDHARAISCFERAIQLFPEWGAAHYALALSYRAIGHREEAQRALERHKKFGSRWPAVDDPMLAGVAALRDDAQTKLGKGLKLAAADDTAGAIMAHEAALAVDPSIAQAHANLISLYGSQKNWTKAEEHYRAVVALGFNLGDAHYDYGVLLGLQERWAEAANAYRQAIAVNPHHARAYNNLGQTLERLQDIAAAADAYRHAVDAEPTFRLARFNLGRMLIAQGRNSEAVAELERLTEPRDAEAPRYLFALATAHVRAGHKEEGVKWALAARDLAVAHDQRELAAAIEKELSTLR